MNSAIPHEEHHLAKHFPVQWREQWREQWVVSILHYLWCRLKQTEAKTCVTPVWIACLLVGPLFGPSDLTSLLVGLSDTDVEGAPPGRLIS